MDGCPRSRLLGGLHPVATAGGFCFVEPSASSRLRWNSLHLLNFIVSACPGGTPETFISVNARRSAAYRSGVGEISPPTFGLICFHAGRSSWIDANHRQILFRSG